MGKVNETLKTVNSTLRTMLMVVLFGGAGYGGYLAYDLYNEPQKKLAEKQQVLDKTLKELRERNEALAAQQAQIAELDATLQEKAAEIERLEVAMRLLKVRRRLAQLTVLDQREVPQEIDTVDEAGATESADPPPTQLVSRVQFVEVNEEGDPIGQAKQFDIVGDLVYIDYLRVTFDDKYVEQADLDRSTAIALFQRLFGEHQEAIEGFQLDEVGTRPTAYARGTEMSDFEKKIWDDFWLIANDPARAAELGIHAAHGAAVSMRVQPGKTYEIELRSTGDITIRPLEEKTPAPSS